MILDTPKQLAEDNRRERERYIELSKCEVELKRRGLDKETCIKIALSLRPDAPLVPF